MESNRKRKALSDLTNRNTPSSSSSVNKPPSFSPPLLSKQITKTPITSKSKSKTKPTATANSKNNDALNHVFPFTTPIKSSLLSGTRDCEVSEPCSVYSRRSPNKRKSKDKAIPLPLTLSPARIINNTREKNKEDRDTGLSKSSIEHSKKKKKDDSQHDLQDYIEKQRAYFAEIDAFELPVEEVETVDNSEE